MLSPDDIKELCALWAEGESASAIARRFGFGTTTAWKYANRHATDEQKAAHDRNAHWSQNGRPVITDTNQVYRESATVDWHGAQFSDDPRAVEDDNYLSRQARPATHVPTVAGLA